MHVRLTGPAAVESDEFATFKENAALNAVLILRLQLSLLRIRL